MAAILLLVLVAGSLAGWAALKKFSASKTQHRTVTSVPPAGAQEPFALSKESVSSEPSRRSNGLVATVGEIKKGRDVYMGKCAKCHQFYDPAAYNDFDWNNWMGKMRGEAKLNGDQSELLNRFLGTIRNP